MIQSQQGDHEIKSDFTWFYVWQPLYHLRSVVLVVLSTIWRPLIWIHSSIQSVEIKSKHWLLFSRKPKSMIMSIGFVLHDSLNQTFKNNSLPTTALLQQLNVKHNLSSFHPHSSPRSSSKTMLFWSAHVYVLISALKLFVMFSSILLLFPNTDISYRALLYRVFFLTGAPLKS